MRECWQFVTRIDHGWDVPEARSGVDRRLIPAHSSILASLLMLVTLLAVSAAQAQSGPVGLWTFDTGTVNGTQVSDSSGNNLTGTTYGGITPSAGILNQGLTFNGSSGFIAFAPDTLTDLTNNLSLSLWVKTQNSSRLETLISRYNASGYEYGYLLRDDPSGHLELRIGAWNGVGTALVDTGKAINDGQWHHVAAVITLGQGVQFYIDGALSSSQAANVIATPSGTSLQIGLNPWNPYGYWFTGSMDDVRIYNRSLSATEVASLANASPPPPSPALSVAPLTLTFNATSGGSDAAAQTIGVTNSGTGTLSWSAVANVTTSQSWLTLSSGGVTNATSISGTNAQTVSVNATMSTLTPGTYTGTVVFSAPLATPSTQTVIVTFVIAPASSGGSGGGTGPVGLWTFDTGTVNGTQVLDSSGNELTGTIQGSVTPSTGILNQGLTFNGSSGFIAFAPDTLTDLTNNLSLSLWVKTQNSSRLETLISRYNASGYEYGYLLRDDPSGHLELRIGAWNGVGTALVDTGKAINDGQWHHVAAVITLGQGVQFYIDGALSSSQAANVIATPSGTSLQIGLNPWNPYGYWFTGSMDDVRIYNRALSASEIAALAAAQGSVGSPALSASPLSLTFNGVQGGANPASQTVGVSNNGTGTLNWTAVSNQPWITLASDAVSGASSISGTNAQTIAISTAIGSAGPGTYTGTVTITAPGATPSTQTVNVSLIVASPNPGVSASPLIMSFNGTAGGASPTAQTVNITNSGGGTLSWTATAATTNPVTNPSWLTVSFGGTNNASSVSGSGAQMVSVNATTGALIPGTYSGTVVITGTGANPASQTVNVSFVVAAQTPPGVSASPLTMTFNATAGGTSPASQTVNIMNSGGGTLSWTATAATTNPVTNPSWLTVSFGGTNNASSVSGSGAQMVSVNAAIGTLTAGTYLGTVTIVGSGANPASQTVNVTFVVAAGAGGGGGAGPVGYWTFDTAQLSGSHVLDISGNNLTGTLQGGVTPGTGIVNQALNFDGTSGYISFESDTFTDLTNSMSLALWVKTQNNSRLETLISRYNASGYEYGYLLGDDPAGHIELRIGAWNGVGASLADTGKVINDGQWHHVAVVITLGQGVAFYIDGALSSTKAANVVATPSGALLQIGLNPWNPYGYWFTGSMDEVRIYNRALTAAEVSALAAVSQLPTVSTPVISPAAGTYSNSVQVTITPAQGSTTYYTTNGSDPTTSSTHYSAPFTLTSTTTVKAFSVANGQNNSAIASSVFTVPPAVPLSASITSPGANQQLSGSVQVSATAAGSIPLASIQLQLDNSTLGTPCASSPCTITWDTTKVSNGTHSLMAVATDTSNAVASSAAVSVTVQNTVSTGPPPTVVMEGPAFGATLSGLQLMQAGATASVGVPSVQFLVNGLKVGPLETATPYQFNWETGSVPNGTYTLTALATDSSGNQTVSLPFTVFVNNPAPSGAQVTFLGVDTTTQGNWKGVYGQDGNVMANAATLGPSYSTFTAGNANMLTVQNPSPDPRALQDQTLSTRIESYFYNRFYLDMNVSATDNQTHRIALYFCDYTYVNRSITVQAVDTVSGVVLDTRVLASYTGGVYLVYNYNGAITFHIQNNNSSNPAVIPNPNANISGVFWGGSGGPATNSPTSSVDINTPQTGASVSGTLPISATATGASIASMQLFVDDVNIGACTSSSCSVNFDTTTIANGTHTLFATATDTSSHTADSSPVTITVANAVTPIAPGGFTGSVTPVGYWTFDTAQLSGSQVFDSSGNNLTGTIGGGVTPTTGVVNQALSFDGSTGYINLPSTAATDLTSSLSIAMWIKTQNASRVEALVSRYNTTGAGTGYIFRTTASGHIELLIGGNNGINAPLTDTGKVINDGQWHHVVAVIGLSQGVYFYIDGALSSSNIVDVLASPTQSSFVIGVNPWNPFGYFFTGSMDEVRIYNRVLSASEVATLAAAGGTQGSQNSGRVSGAPAGLTAFGDSITVGYGVFPETLGYEYLMASTFGGTNTNNGVNGDQSADMANRVFANLSNAGTQAWVTMMIGANDAQSVGTGTGPEGNYNRSLLASIAWAALPRSVKVFGQDAGCVKTGTWTADNTVVSGVGEQSSSTGAHLDCTVTSPNGVIYAAYRAIDSNAGTMSVKIDGVTPDNDATLTASGTAGTCICTGNGETSTVFLARYSGYSAGSHTITFTVTSTSGTNTVMFVGVPFTPSTSTARVLVAGVPWQENNTSGAATAAYNTDSLTDSALMAGDGLPVDSVNVRNFLNSTNDFLGGAVLAPPIPGVSSCSATTSPNEHPGTCGHDHLAQAFEAAYAADTGG